MIYSAHSWMNEQDRTEKKAEAGKENVLLLSFLSKTGYRKQYSKNVKKV